MLKNTQRFGIIALDTKEKILFLLCFSDLVLHGLDLESEHCIFENVGGTVTLIPLSGSQCSVNGVQITEATHLNQGICFLVFNLLCIYCY